MIGDDEILATSRTPNLRYVVAGFHDDKTIKFYDVQYKDYATKCTEMDKLEDLVWVQKKNLYLTIQKGGNIKLYN